MDSKPEANQENPVAAAKQAEVTALGKVIIMVSEKLKEHLLDEIEYYCLRAEPILYDKHGSDVPRRTWKANGMIKADFINKNSDNLNQLPLAKFFDMLDTMVNNSRDMVTIQMKIRNGGIESCEDEIFEQFFTQEYQIQTLETEDGHYVGTVNKFGKPEGIGRMIYANNGIYEGAFKNGDPSGYGRRFEPSGSIFNGTYMKGIRKGRGTLLDKKGIELKGNWWHYTFEGEIKKPNEKEGADA